MKFSSLKELVSQNKTLFGKIFLTVISQLFITFITVYCLRGYPNIVEKIYSLGVFLCLFILSIFLIFGILSTLPTSVRIVLFCLLSIILGLFLARFNKINKEVLTSSVLGTLSIFVVMFIFGILSVYYNFDLLGLGSILFFALLILILSNVIFLLCGVSSTAYKVYIYIGLVIFSLYIVFDTYLILKKYETDFVSGALSYYLDIINIFTKLVYINNN